MCMGTPNVTPAAPLPNAMPTAETTATGAGQAILDQYSNALRRKGISSTVRSSGATQTSQTNQGLASSGTNKTLG